MKRIAMIAREDFNHFDGRSIARGTFFETLPIEAAVLNRQRKARFATADERAQASAPPVPAKAMTADTSARKPRTPRKPRTQRRDIPHAPITK
jgi:hypothetical protein